MDGWAIGICGDDIIVYTVFQLLNHFMVWSSWYLVHHMLMRWRQINIVVNELSKRNWFGKPSEARDKSRTYFVIDCWDFSLLGFIIVWFCFWFIIGVGIFDCWDLLWLDAVALGFIVVANYSWYTCLLHAYKLACPIYVAIYCCSSYWECIFVEICLCWLSTLRLKSND